MLIQLFISPVLVVRIMFSVHHLMLEKELAIEGVRNIHAAELLFMCSWYMEIRIEFANRSQLLMMRTGRLHSREAWESEGMFMDTHSSFTET